MIGNLVGRFRGLAGERFHLGRHHGKAAAGIACAGRLDGGVQRQQIGLLGNRGDQLDDIADLLRGARQFSDPPVGLFGLTHGGFRDLAGLLNSSPDLVDGGRQFLGRRRHRLHVGGSFFRGAGNLAGQALGGFSRPRQRARGCFKLHGRRRYVGDNGADRGLEFVGEANQFGAPRFARRLVLGFLGGGVALGAGDGLHLNSSTALAISPSSSLRPRPGSTTSKLPPASSRIALHISIIGREIPLPSNTASTPPSRKPPAASAMIRRSVSPMAASDSDSSLRWSESRSAFIALAPFTIVAADSFISTTSSSTDFELSTNLLSACR